MLILFVLLLQCWLTDMFLNKRLTADIMVRYFNTYTSTAHLYLNMFFIKMCDGTEIVPSMYYEIYRRDTYKSWLRKWPHAGGMAVHNFEVFITNPEVWYSSFTFIRVCFNNNLESIGTC